MLLRSRRNFLILFVLIACVEICIATFFTDTFVRPLLGDVFVAMLVYSFVRTITSWTPLQTAVSVWLFTLLVEVSQALDLITGLGLEHNYTARLVLGTDFDWRDILAYTLGVWIIYKLDARIKNL